MISGPGKRLSARLLLGAALLLAALLATATSAQADAGRAGAVKGAADATTAGRGDATHGAGPPAGAAAAGTANAAQTKHTAIVAGARTVHFAGRTVRVPAGFRVVRVAPHSRTCVRLDRRVVYLGAPSEEQRCPAGPVLGRRRAIVVSPHPGRGRAATPAAARPRSAHPGAGRTGGGRRGAAAHASKAPATASVGGSVFTGLGFDTCSAPSSKAMAAWAESPFRGVGIYIGGENSACSQPNLSAGWVSAQTTAGWHLIPTYVGLQATTSSCASCAKMTAAAAGAQGAAAAEDAVAAATGLGIDAGSPIYFDLEAYSPTARATDAALTFLAAWTDTLHALGYQSGVYSSGGSGIADLADQVGTGYSLPDDLWIADWNYREDTESDVVPSNAWADHQRIHQFRGGHDDIYGGVRINIDSNFVDGATVGVGTPPVGASDPVGDLELTGSPRPGQVRVRGWAFDPDAPTEVLAINVVVGGREGQKGVERYEMGQIADQSRPAATASSAAAGPSHGFDANVVTVKSGPEPVCVYAVNVALGADRLLGCRTTRIPAAVTFSRLKPMPHGIKVTLACQWPAGTACPGHLGVRTTFKVATPRRHRKPRIHRVTRSLGSRTFHLTGGRWHTFYLPLNRRGRKMLQERRKLHTQVVVAIPGGRRGAGLPLEARPRHRAVDPG